MKILRLSPLLVVITIVASTNGFITHCNISTIAFEEAVIVDPNSEGEYYTVTPILSATCKGPHGKYVNSTLDLNHCLVNHNATLAVGSLR
jgi:hypothetical protein